MRDGQIGERMTEARKQTAETYLLGPNGGIPNNPRLPALVLRSTIALDDDDPAASFERVFRANGWRRTWRNGIYPYHHYHSNAHETLGIARGSARVRLGGPEGVELGLAAGDVAILPAGFGHCNLGASEDLLVIGAYPDGPDWDLCRAGDLPDERALEQVSKVPVPASDPVHGANGPLVIHWQ